MAFEQGQSIRIGDPLAPRWVSRGVERHSRAILAGVIVLALSVVITVGALLIRDAEPSRVWSFGIGLMVAFVIVLGGVALWSRYWAGLGRAVADAEARRPEALVLGGRLPRLLGNTMEEIWPSSIAPLPAAQHVLVLADVDGVRVVALGNALLVALGWPQVRAIEVVEYVEDGKAYDGIAIFGPTAERAIVLQPIMPTLVGARILGGTALQKVKNDLTSRRRDGAAS